ncbi:hypothetical protein WSK_0030 [Novosphingobium sp. Rr 2-17]|uniref:hypothetical protein n=1 Tax=Novosphingobium sp. Rr 2-17 TaxID=555793 RepID=UPI000269A777|nr:hypothetical protein [Novosphingobium sp. Rr 2-17]EIZ81324.1 hypothetical protein WSK_0030 [Novosphingobium sp. Rr 2-17]
MNIASALLAPLALLLPAAIEQAVTREGNGPDSRAISVGFRPVAAWTGPDWAGRDWSDTPGPVTNQPPRGARTLPQAARPQPTWQIRIEQRVQIRIAPRAAMPMPPNMLEGAPRQPGPRRLMERKIGKCLPIAGIVGVDPDRANTLLLMMRDHRLLSAELERSCRARDFYSGFYLSRTKDGLLCVDRDTLLSRSGANCKLTRLRELIEDPDH